MRSVELFAGAGGLAIGMAKAGFHHAAVIEWNSDACETFRENKRHHTHHVEEWPLHEADVRKFDYGTLSREIMVVSGGPPCQPFSMGGKHRGHMDERDMFPQAVRAVRELRPKAFIFENVKGLKRETFANYFEYVRLQLTHPSLIRRKAEPWREHCRALGKARDLAAARLSITSSPNCSTPRITACRKSRDVFIVGFREDLGVEWSFPEETHSDEELLRAKWLTGDYWERHEVAKKHRPRLEDRHIARIEKLKRGALFGTDEGAVAYRARRHQ